MSDGLIVRTLNDTPVQQRRTDGYWNATAMCKAAGKEWSGYARNQVAHEFLAELESVLQICRTDLVQVRQGGSPAEQGTWVHPRVAVNLAQWCSPRFAVAVTGWVLELVTTGRVELRPVGPALRPYTNRVMETPAVESNVPDGYWCIFIESARVLIAAERILEPAGLRLDVEDLLDGSIGRRYSQHREGKPWAGERVRYPYRFPPPSARSGIVVRPYAYPNCELLHFREWLRYDYLPKDFHAYLRAKYGVPGYQAALPHIRRVMPAAVGPGRPPSLGA